MPDFVNNNIIEGQIVSDSHNMIKILLIEDELNIASFIKKGLIEESYSVDIAENGTIGIERALSGEYDLIILDIMLPDLDGINICKEMRKRGLKTPVFMLTAIDLLHTKVEGFESGADDYLTKPFEFAELVVRIKALLRRTSERTGELSVDDLKMDLLTRKVFRNNIEILLSPKEFALLEYLMKNSGTVVTRTQMLRDVWGYDFDPETNVIEVHIRALRQKIDEGFQKRLIHTVRGSGYILKVEGDNDDFKA